MQKRKDINEIKNKVVIHNVHVEATWWYHGRYKNICLRLPHSSYIYGTRTLARQLSLDLAQWLERPSSHPKVVGLIPVWASEIFFLRQDVVERPWISPSYHISNVSRT